MRHSSIQMQGATVVVIFVRVPCPLAHYFRLHLDDAAMWWFSPH